LDQVEFRQGLRDIAPMTIAYAPIAALWGTVAASKGLSPLEAVLMSAGLYSGAAQFVAMDLWNTGIPLVMLVLTIATVSLRHVLMSASIARHIASFPKLKASALLFWLTDEAWAMLERRALTKPITPSYFLGVGMPLWPNWFFFTGLGAWFGAGIEKGQAERFGLDFAFAAMFIAVVAGFWKGTGTAMILIASSIAAVAGKLMLPGAWYILAGGVAGMLVAALTYRETQT
jgi:predicted branched-subunit amino acid permease